MAVVMHKQIWEILMTHMVQVLMTGLLVQSVSLAEGQAAEWEARTTDLIRQEKPGFGGLCGVAVDPRSGDLYIDLSDRGVYRSADAGKSWSRLSAVPLKGRTEWPGAMMLDPVGKTDKLVVPTVYGSGIAVRPKPGAAWKQMNHASSHVDWCAVDWTDPEMKFVLALKHESGGLLIVSRDGGATFEPIGKGYGPAWVFDPTTAVIAWPASKDPNAQLLRTADAARTFQPCGEYRTKALPKWHSGKLYWLVDGAIVTTTDKGISWQKLCDLKNGQYGPVFGADARQMFVLTGAGIVESTDGGAAWSKPIPLPAAMKGGGPLTWIAYDPTRKLLYAMKMGSDLYRMARDR
jgi:photosystem II stability/assembly factor-like uncharacterized protein